jgi:hypothetical protein
LRFDFSDVVANNTLQISPLDVICRLSLVL